MEYLPYILDGIVILVIGFLMVQGAREGFMFAAFSFLPMLCAFVGVRLFATTVAGILQKTAFYDNAVSMIAEKISLDTIFAERWMEPDLLSYLDLPEAMENFLAKTSIVEIDISQGLDGATMFFAESVADVCLFIFSSLLVFFVILIGMKIVLRLLDAVANLPVLAFFNQTLGAGLGAVQGVLWIWVACTILALHEFGGTSAEIFAAMADTKLTSILYENNILLHLILQVFG